MPHVVFPDYTLAQPGLGPALEGFGEAQARLREKFGVDAVFIIAGAKTWPAGTPLDPETGKPYDPFLNPETLTPATEITVRCSFVHRPLDAQFHGADPAQAPIGAIDRGNAALVMTPADYATVSEAKRVRVDVEVWDISQWRLDVALTIPRWIAYLVHA